MYAVYAAYRSEEVLVLDRRIALEAGKVTFSPEEWASFNIRHISLKHYIKAGLDEELNDVYFVPLAVEEPGRHPPCPPGCLSTARTP